MAVLSHLGSSPLMLAQRSDQSHDDTRLSYAARMPTDHDQSHT